MKLPVTTRPFHAFLVTWVGLVVTWFGSGLTTFALGTFMYQRSGSVTQYGLFQFFYFLPMMLLSPVAGALIDRWDRRRVLILAELGAGVSAALIWLLLHTSDKGLWQLELWHLYVLIALGSCFGTFQLPACYAATSLLVPKEQLGRANGMIELAFGAGQILAPLTVGQVLASIGLQGIVLMDVVSFALSITLLLFIRYPPTPPLTEEAQADQKSLWRETVSGWHYIRARPGLLQLMVFIGVLNLVTGMVIVLITPLVLSFTDVPTLSRVMSFAGVGMVVGAVVMTAWGGPKRRVHGVLGFYLLSAFALFAAALPPTALIVAGGAFVFIMCSPLILSCMQAIWQSKVPPALQGRVFSVRRMLGLAATPIAALISGPLCDHLFEPLLAPGGALEHSVGRVLGVGKGRGIAFVFVVLGVTIIVHTLVSYLSPRIRNVEDELPDALADHSAPPDSVPTPGTAAVG
ncbi:MFS transporter [Archangium lansingense]|uniref:MFS transporter n=1 Tax=Archangium lansingense TaxID=2995310 RepID=A0ABT4A9P4_9BACT|nr:MFS transporter [Archangium lansinium]MCY1078388.1 MFS transporter [Archangium lansinium]